MKLPRYRSRYPHHQFPKVRVDGMKLQIFCRVEDLDDNDWSLMKDFVRAKLQQRELLKKYL